MRSIIICYGRGSSFYYSTCCYFDRHYFSMTQNNTNCFIKIYMMLISHIMWLRGLLSPWSYGSWIYNYLFNRCLSPLMWVRISTRARCTTLCYKVCQWLATGRWFSPGPLVSSTDKTDRHDITEIFIIVESGIKHHKTNKQTPSCGSLLFLCQWFYNYGS